MYMYNLMRLFFFIAVRWYLLLPCCR